MMSDAAKKGYWVGNFTPLPNADMDEFASGYRAPMIESLGPFGGKLLMVAHVLPYFPEFRWILEAVQSGRYGRLLAGSFRLQNHPTGQVAILRGTENHTRSPTPPAQASRLVVM